jgi:hypothetical protein
VGKWGSGEVGKWGSGEVGKWGSGEVGKWGSGEVGKWGVGCQYQIRLYFMFIRKAVIIKIRAN